LPPLSLPLALGLVACGADAKKSMATSHPPSAPAVTATPSAPPLKVAAYVGSETEKTVKR
jgi:hypothetical protein